jgi:hypothetical protein
VREEGVVLAQNGLYESPLHLPVEHLPRKHPDHARNLWQVRPDELEALREGLLSGKARIAPPTAALRFVLHAGGVAGDAAKRSLKCALDHAPNYPDKIRVPFLKGRKILHPYADVDSDDEW